MNDKQMAKAMAQFGEVCMAVSAAYQVSEGAEKEFAWSVVKDNIEAMWNEIDDAQEAAKHGEVKLCEHCGGPNERGSYANWCEACSSASAENAKAEQAKRDLEFQNHMLNRPN